MDANRRLEWLPFGPLRHVVKWAGPTGCYLTLYGTWQPDAGPDGSLVNIDEICVYAGEDIPPATRDTSEDIYAVLSTRVRNEVWETALNAVSKLLTQSRRKVYDDTSSDEEAK